MTGIILPPQNWLPEPRLLIGGPADGMRISTKADTVYITVKKDSSTLELVDQVQVIQQPYHARRYYGQNKSYNFLVWHELPDDIDLFELLLKHYHPKATKAIEDGRKTPSKAIVQSRDNSVLLWKGITVLREESYGEGSSTIDEVSDVLCSCGRLPYSDTNWRERDVSVSTEDGIDPFPECSFHTDRRQPEVTGNGDLEAK